MNKTMAVVAVVLAMITAAFVMIPHQSDGLTENSKITIDGVEYTVLTKTATDMYTSSETLSPNIYVSGSSVSSYCFSDNRVVEKVYLGPNCKTIGSCAFMNCQNLEVIYAESVRTIYEKAMYNSNISEFHSFGGLTSVEKSAFSMCGNLTVFDSWNSRISSIGIDAFKNTGIQIMDLRGVQTLKYGAFDYTPLKFQIVDDSTNTDLNVPRISIVGDVRLNGAEIRGSTVTLCTEDDSLLTVRTSGGMEVDVTFSSSDGTGRNSFATSSGTDYTVGAAVHTVRYPAELGLADESVPTGAAHTFRTPAMGDLPFVGWQTAGIQGTFTSLTGAQMSSLGEVIEVTPKFGSLKLGFDHSAVSGFTDVSGLPVSTDFTYGSEYPDCPDVKGYAFSHWDRGGVSLNPGDRISDYSEHTVKSVWTPTETFTVEYRSLTDAAIHSEKVNYGVSVTIGTHEPGENDSRRFIGWKSDRHAGIFVAGESVAITQDTVFRPDYAQRTEYTVTLISDGTGFGEYQVYDGRTFTVPQDIPSKKFHRFDGWSTGATTYAPGDGFAVGSDMTLTAQWTKLPTAIVTVNTPGIVSEEVLIGSDFTLPSEYEPREHFTFIGWSSEDGSSEAEYGPGDVINVTGSITLYPVWKEDRKVTVTFEWDGTYEITPYAEQKIVLDHAPDDRDFFTFLGWSSERESAEAEFTVGSEYSFDSDITLYPVWKEDEKVTIKFDCEGIPDITPYVNQKVTIDQAPDDRDHFEFLGWSSSKNSTEAEFTDGPEYSFDSNMTLYPVWREDEKVDIVFQSEGVDPLNPYVDQPILIDRTPAEMEHFTFLGWSATDGSETAEYRVGEEYRFRESLVLYPVWEENSHVFVTYTLAVPLVEKYYIGESNTVTAEPDPREHYTFLGWSSSKGSSEAEYVVGESYMFDSSLMLHPVWEEDPKVTVTLHSDSPLVFHVYIGDTLTIDTVPSEREHCTFLGWSAADGSSDPSYRNGTAYGFDSDTDLYPVWLEGPRATVTYAVGNATVEISVYIGDEIAVGCENTAPEGQKLSHWIVDGDPGRQIPDGETYTVERDVTFTPVYVDLLEFTLRFFHDGMELRDLAIVCTEGDEIYLPDPENTEGESAFVGWRHGETIYNVGTGLVPSSDMDLEAVTGDTNHHVVVIRTNPEIVVLLPVDVPLTMDMLPEPVREDHDLVGWSLTEGGDAVVSGDAGYTPGNRIELYPVWREHPTVTYEHGDTRITFHFRPGAAVVLGEGTDFERTGFSLDGWTDGESGYGRGESVAFADSVVLHPVWKEILIGVTFHGSGLEGPVSYQRDVPSVVTQVPLPKDFHDFMGWSFSESSETADIAPGASHVFTGDCDLYPVWREHDVLAVTFAMDEPVCVYVHEGESLTIAAEPPHRNGYVFRGWSVQAGDGSPDYLVGESYTFGSDVTLHPVWSTAGGTVTDDDDPIVIIPEGGSGGDDGDSGSGGWNGIRVDPQKAGIALATVVGVFSMLILMVHIRRS